MVLSVYLSLPVNAATGAAPGTKLARQNLGGFVRFCRTPFDPREI